MLLLIFVFSPHFRESLFIHIIDDTTSSQPGVCSKYIYNAWLFAFLQELDILHSRVLIRENSLYCPACNIRMLSSWSMWRERDWATVFVKQTHCVSMTWMFCCVLGKSLPASHLVTISVMMLFAWRRLLSDRQWSSRILSDDPRRV